MDFEEPRKEGGQPVDELCSSLRTWEDWEGGRARMHPAFFRLFRILTTTGLQSTTGCGHGG